MHGIRSMGVSKMATCKKCKKSLGFFDKSYECMEEGCPATYCNACATTELVDCEYCSDAYCKKHLETHTPDCKAENETTDETCDECGELMSECTCDTEDDVDMPDGMYFNKDKTICILDIEDNKLNVFIDHLDTLRKDFIIDKDLSNDQELVWIKKVV